MLKKEINTAKICLLLTFFFCFVYNHIGPDTPFFSAWLYILGSFVFYDGPCCLVCRFGLADDVLWRARLELVIELHVDAEAHQGLGDTGNVARVVDARVRSPLKHKVQLGQHAVEVGLDVWSKVVLEQLS